jgi:hypothetical protein
LDCDSWVIRGPACTVGGQRANCTCVAYDKTHCLNVLRIRIRCIFKKSKTLLNYCSLKRSSLNSECLEEVEDFFPDRLALLMIWIQTSFARNRQQLLHAGQCKPGYILRHDRGLVNLPGSWSSPSFFLSCSFAPFNLFLIIYFTLYVRWTVFRISFQSKC